MRSFLRILEPSFEPQNAKNVSIVQFNHVKRNDMSQREIARKNVIIANYQ